MNHKLHIALLSLGTALQKEGWPYLQIPALDNENEVHGLRFVEFRDGQTIDISQDPKLDPVWARVENLVEAFGFRLDDDNIIDV